MVPYNEVPYDEHRGINLELRCQSPKEMIFEVVDVATNDEKNDEHNEEYDHEILNDVILL
jgi:hypothetical protein